ncbi:MAG: hypothetical protein IT293_04705 [Deltaproteobacteria bacterium]|nr:hypothetical protein [Deltaproteobacteria bacterium]
MIGARPLVSILAACTLAACATQTIETGGQRTVRTVGAEVPATAPQSTHGYVEGELLIVFTPAGEKTVASLVAKPPTKLRFGVPSLDRLNAKYRAIQLIKVADLKGAYILRIAPDANVFRAVEEYRKDPLVTATDLHYLYRLPASQAPEAVRTQTGPLRRDPGTGRPR